MIFPREQIAVFIDGCFWHACPTHFVAPKTHSQYWDVKIERNRLRDTHTNLLLADAGWTVFRFWAHEPPEKVARTIVSAVKRKSKGLGPSHVHRAANARDVTMADPENGHPLKPSSKTR